VSQHTGAKDVLFLGDAKEKPIQPDTFLKDLESGKGKEFLGVEWCKRGVGWYLGNS